MSRVPASRPIRIAALLLICGLMGLGLFGLFAWRAVTVEDATRADAERRLATIRAGMPFRPPLVEMDEEGRVLRMQKEGEQPGRPIARLRTIAWRAAERRLVSVDSPFWFVKLKGPAAAYVLQDTGLDLDRLGLTPTVLERFGPAIIVDHTSRDGSRLLMWTE